MTDSPIRIAVELDGIEPSDRFQAALDELAAAADALLAESAEVSGFVELAVPDVLTLGDWSARGPRVRSYVYTPEFKK